MKNITQYILVILLATITVFLILGGLHKEKVEKNKFAEIAVVYNAEQKEQQEKIDLMKQSIYEDIPGIVAWGDSLTVGVGGEETNYPNVLQRLIKTNVYDIPVINMGVGGEDTHTIMGRAGSVPFVVDSFTIPGDTSKVKINIKSSNGNAVAPLRQGDRGINPVIINGISGIISIEKESSSSQAFTYYFNRIEQGTPVNIENGAIITNAASIDYQKYIPIVFMGQNGGWDGKPGVLISQIKSILNMDKWNGKNLVLGLTSGTTESSADLEFAMESEFGNRYINLRKYLVENGLKQAGLEATETDMKAIQQGSIPPSLLSDEIHFNAIGYKVIGQAVYERMMYLGYFNKIIEIKKQQ